MDRRENFKRLAEARTNKLLKALELLGNLSNRSYYDYTPGDVEKIFDILQEELEEQKKRFTNRKVKTKRFRL